MKLPDRQQIGVQHTLSRLWDRADSPSWPIQALVVFSAGVGAGFVLATSDFDSPLAADNGWVRLAVLAAGMLLVSCLAAFFKGPVHRRLQLALLLSLLIHAAAGAGLGHTRLTTLVRATIAPNEAADALDKPKPVTLPEYRWTPVHKPKPIEEPFEQPVKVEQEPAPAEIDLARTSDSSGAPQPPQALYEPAKPSAGLLSEATLEPAEAAAVRQTEELAGIQVRRQEIALDRAGFAGINEAIDVPAPPALDELAASSDLPRAEPIETVVVGRSGELPASVAGDELSLATPEPSERRDDELGIAPQLAETTSGERLAERFPALPRDEQALAPPRVRIDTPDVTTEAGFAATRLGPAPELAPVVRLTGPELGDSRLLTPEPALASTDVDFGERTVAVTPDRSRLEVPVRTHLNVAGEAGEWAVIAAQALERQPAAPDVAPHAEVDVPSLPALEGAGQSLAGPLPADLLDLARNDSNVAALPRGGLPIEIDAPLGPGGLYESPRADLGIPDRLARPELDLIAPAPGRLILERSGATAGDPSHVRDTAVPGFQRDLGGRGQVAEKLGGTRASEEAVERGLDFLARLQEPDGSWSLHDFGDSSAAFRTAGQAQMRSSTAGTGLALLAFLGAGYTHTDGRHQAVVARALDYLLNHQKADGDLFVPQDEASNQNVWLYSHGIASIALCEAYGMTRAVELREPAQRALDFIVAAQDPKHGGWRYAPRIESDTSVSGWQVMALKSGELAGLFVPAEVYARVTEWLDRAQTGAGNAEYAYNPQSTFAHQREPSRVMTAEALLMRQYLGWRRDQTSLLAGAKRLLTELPQWAGRPYERDCYYWYYGTQVMFHLQGAAWQTWNDQLRPLLVDSQVGEGPLAGSWDPAGQFPDRWGYAGGRIYVTAMHLLILEVYYRHLPLYQTIGD